VGADLGILLNLIHKELKERSKLAIAQKDYKPISKFEKHEFFEYIFVLLLIRTRCR
jgi:hypothetical protein